MAFLRKLLRLCCFGDATREETPELPPNVSMYPWRLSDGELVTVPVDWSDVNRICDDADKRRGIKRPQETGHRKCSSVYSQPSGFTLKRSSGAPTPATETSRPKVGHQTTNRAKLPSEFGIVGRKDPAVQHSAGKTPEPSLIPRPPTAKDLEQERLDAYWRKYRSTPLLPSDY